MDLAMKTKYSFDIHSVIKKKDLKRRLVQSLFVIIEKIKNTVFNEKKEAGKIG